MWINKSLLFGLFFTIVLAEKQFKICAPNKDASVCEQLQRGDAPVSCQWVQDSIECAKCIQNGTADFGAFSAESALQLGVLGWDGLSVVQQIRDNKRRHEPVDFESVVVVRKDHLGGVAGLKGRKYCHPGLHYGITEKWTERFLKEMERVVVDPVCNKDYSSAEIEVSSLSQFFDKACRPGIWSHDIKEDAMLKKKYPNLCSLCSKNDCEYNASYLSGGGDKNHQQALNCLTDGNDVAYVSRQDAESFFATKGSSTEFRYLCPNGTIEQISDNKTPCVWLRQPWSTIIVSSSQSVNLSDLIASWFSKAKANVKPGWENSVVQILGAQNSELSRSAIQNPGPYIRDYREVPLPQSICNTEISWCTTSLDERDKCLIVRAGGISSGAQPLIICRDPAGSVIQCMEDISKNNSDFMGIDSNYGYLARQLYSLTSAMYFETEKSQYSKIVVVVHAESNIKNFADLRKKQVCLPEFGSTPSIAFINWGKSLNYFDQKECRHGHILNNFFGDSCAPGAQDWKHFLMKSDAPDGLCTLCLSKSVRPESHIAAGMRSESINSPDFQTIGNIGTCSADISNKYFGNRGALRCLNDLGDVAILELQSLKDHAKDIGVDYSKFRILCRNGSLAQNTGFDVDANCALTTIVDGEIVVRRGSQKLTSIVNAMNALDTYFQVHPDFKMYNIFNSQRNLLFKDSTLGLTAANDDNHGATVKSYIELFKNIEKCAGNSAVQLSILSSFIFIIAAHLIF